MTIKRTQPNTPGRTRRVEHGEVVYCVMTADDKTDTMKGQTEQALAQIDEHLAAAGTDKSRILTTTVYISDMAKKDEMDEAWLAWVDPQNPPARACLGVTLHGTTQVEFVLSAAK
jgi:enamine deaminase RidA (YjgF/YER057c/UK114 family)